MVIFGVVLCTNTEHTQLAMTQVRPLPFHTILRLSTFQSPLRTSSTMHTRILFSLVLCISRSSVLDHTFPFCFLLLFQSCCQQHSPVNMPNQPGFSTMACGRISYPMAARFLDSCKSTTANPTPFHYFIPKLSPFPSFHSYISLFPPAHLLPLSSLSLSFLSLQSDSSSSSLFVSLSLALSLSLSLSALFLSHSLSPLRSSLTLSLPLSLS